MLWGSCGNLRFDLEVLELKLGLSHAQAVIIKLMGSKDLADLATWIRERLEAMGLTELMIRAFTIIYGSFVISGFIGYGSHLGRM